MKNETSLPRVDKVDSSPALRTHGNGRTELKLADPAQADLADLETATIDLPADANGDFDPPNGHNDTDASCLSENRPRKGGQAHFAPRAPQNEPVPAGSRIGSRPESRVPVVEAAEIASGSRRARPSTRIIVLGALAVILCLFAYFGVPAAMRYLRYESTDDAFVDGHVTYLSPRINGTVTEVLVDDNQHVEKDEVLVRLDAQSLQLAVDQKKAALASAKLMVDQQLAALDAGQAELEQARNQVRGQLAAIRGDWYMLETIRTLIRYQVASVRSSIANLKLQEANLANFQGQYERGAKLVTQSAMSTEEFEQRRTALTVAKEQVATARQSIRQSRALLGLAPDDAHGDEVPADIEESFPGVQYALSGVQQTLAQLGVPFELTNMKTTTIMDRITQFATSSAADQAPAVQLAEAHLRQAKAALGGSGFDPAKPYNHPSVVQAQKELEQAELDLSYAEIRARSPASSAAAR